LETAEQIVLLNWVEAEILDQGSAYLNTFGNGNISMITGTFGGDPEIFILSPVLRTEQKKTVLTLGGLRIPDEVRIAVMDFNRESEDYRIELIDYLGAEGDWYGGLTRFQVELMTGKGPDIIFDWAREIRAPGIMLDLYPLIDADPELDRGDFFPNILRSMEHSDGRLYKISNSFSITSMIGIAEQIRHIESWTLAEMQSLLLEYAQQESPAMQYPLGVLMIGRRFVIERLHSPEFINLENFTANINTQAFIDVLEIAKLLPAEQDIERATTHQLILLLRGEQLLVEWQFDKLLDFLGFAEILGEDFLVLGMPSVEGGVNDAHGHNPMGINAASDHVDAAWEFLRRYLLPKEVPADFNDSILNHPFPIRIDTFNELVDYIKTPKFNKDSQGNPFLDRDGNPIESPLGNYYLWNYGGIGASHELYSITDDTAATLRSFVEKAQMIGNRLSPELFDLIWGDLDAFFEGIRTAEDTARIIQGRVQIYLSEQELVS